ncbi:MAG: transcription antitermination factor NusB [Clostridiales bacterium]|jgi:N utilization substance protein B|nr:transcription antitermination factor NusB [Clostridiales bacterium]MBQ4185222.1 transcription antitermination factor NusB [Clostridiales bacterium]
MSRREAREAAFAFLYQLNFRQEPVSEQKALYLEVHPLDEEDLPYFNEITDGVFEKKDELDAEYSKYLKDWKQSRLPKVDVMLLRIAVYEMLHVSDIPVSVSINEAVVLAKKYSSEESKSYINAILGKVGSTLEK